MGYVDITPPAVSSGNKKSMLLYSADGGVDYGIDSFLTDDGKSPCIKNMWLEDGILTARMGFEEKAGFDMTGSNVHSLYFFGGNEIIHVGKYLYNVNESGTHELTDTVPDSKSIMVEFSGKLYIYCNSYVYSIDRDMNFREEFPYAPLYGKGYSRSLGSGTKLQDFEPNILAPVVKVTYNASKIGGENKYTFPPDIDLTRRFLIYFEDELLDEVAYTYDENYFYLSDDYDQSEDNTVALCYYSTEELIEDKDILSGCTAGISYGGGTLEGTMVILGGNKDYAGRYFTSVTGNALWFRPEHGGVVGNGLEDITAFSPQYSDMLIFTENTVSRMRYSYSSDIGGYFTVYTISNSVGCDMPDSVAMVDNSTVFANSRDGVFIVDTTDNFDRLGILPISANITDSRGKKGYKSIEPLVLKAAVCTVYSRKYMLWAGDRIFVWDFGYGSFVSSSDYVKAARKLIWFEFDGLKDLCGIFSIDGGLYAVKSTDGLCKALSFTGETKDCEYVYRSKSLDMGSPNADKTVTSFRFMCRAMKSTKAEVILFASGKEYYRVFARLEPAADGYACFSAKLPEHMLKRFSFEIRPECPGDGIMNVELGYMILKDNIKM